MGKVEPLFGNMMITKRDYNQMKREVEELLELERNGINDLMELEVYFKRWEDVAQRLKIGGERIDEIEEPITPGVVDVKRKLFDLYRFLLSILGIYDKTILNIMRNFGKEHLHKQMQERILNVLR